MQYSCNYLQLIFIFNISLSFNSEQNSLLQKKDASSDQPAISKNQDAEQEINAEKSEGKREVINSGSFFISVDLFFK